MKIPTKRSALLVPDNINDWEFNEGLEDYVFFCDYGQFLYIDAKAGELYPGCIVVIRPTNRPVRGFRNNDEPIPTYWEIEK